MMRLQCDLKIFLLLQSQMDELFWINQDYVRLDRLLAAKKLKQNTASGLISIEESSVFVFGSWCICVILSPLVMCLIDQTPKFTRQLTMSRDATLKYIQ